MNHRCALHGAVAPFRFHRRPLAAACAVAPSTFEGSEAFSFGGLLSDGIEAFRRVVGKCGRSRRASA